MHQGTAFRPPPPPLTDDEDGADQPARRRALSQGRDDLRLRRGAERVGVGCRGEGADGPVHVREITNLSKGLPCMLAGLSAG